MPAEPAPPDPPARGAEPPTVEVDPRLLVPAAGRVPAEAPADDLAGTTGVLVFGGDAEAWEGPAALGDGSGEALATFLRRVVALTLAVGPVPEPLRGAFDLAAPDRVTAGRWLAGFGRAPDAVLAAALLLRRDGVGTWEGLVAESTTYSLLQAGDAFRRWLAGPRPGPGGDPGPRVRVERRGAVCHAVLTRAVRHNALDTRLRDELHAVLDGLRDEPGTVLALTAEGPSFCSGGDLGEFGTAPPPVAAHAVRLSRSLAWDMAQLADRAVVGLHGACLGAGIEVPAFAGAVIAADDARLGLPEAALGLIPGAGGTVSLPRRIGRQRTLELLVTGEPVDAGTALDWGLVDEVVPRAALEARVLEVAGGLVGRRG